jgi:hypothetical protein
MANPIDSYTPYEFRAADVDTITSTSMVKSGVNVPALALLMRDATSKEIILHDGGTGKVAGIAVYAVDATAATKPIAYYTQICAFEDKVVWPVAANTTLKRQALLDGTPISIRTSTAGY